MCPSKTSRPAFPLRTPPPDPGLFLTCPPHQWSGSLAIEQPIDHLCRWRDTYNGSLNTAIVAMIAPIPVNPATAAQLPFRRAIIHAMVACSTKYAANSCDTCQGRFWVRATRR